MFASSRCLPASSGRQFVTFPQFRGLRARANCFASSQKTFPVQGIDDHTECRSFCMCRTPQRNPQLTHRTNLLSLYRSTSNCSYIRRRGGLGDQLADGVQWFNGVLLTSSPFASHYEVPIFEVRAKRNDTHWVGLQPAANFSSTIEHFRRKDDPHL